MSYLNVKNRVASTLASGILAADLSLTVATGEGVKFPSAPFRITVVDEIMEVTAVATDVFTVVRAKEGTTAIDHTAGDAVELRITAGIIQNLERGAGKINVETLSADKTLVAGTDKMYQYLDPNGASRIITLDTASASAGDRFVIKNNGAYNITYYLKMQQGATSLDYAYAQGTKGFIFDGTNWVANGVGTKLNGEYNIQIGNQASGYSNGVAIGSSASGYSNGVAIGYSAGGYSNGVSIGYLSNGRSNGVGIGIYAEGTFYGAALGGFVNTNSKYYSIALGYYSKCSRYGETAVNIDGQSTYKNQAIQGRLTIQTTDATATELLAAGYAGQRFTIRASSHFAFKGIVIARDDVNNAGMSWEIKGMIKQDGAGNTALVGTPTITEIAKDGVLAWSIAITADDVNEALIITATGEAAKTIRWAAVLDGVEVIV